MWHCAVSYKQKLKFAHWQNSTKSVQAESWQWRQNLFLIKQWCIGTTDVVVSFRRFYVCYMTEGGPPLWSSGQSFWLEIQRSRVRSPALPDFLSSSGSGTESTQPREPREVNWGATWMKKSRGSRFRKQRLTAVGTRCADHVTPLYPQKVGTNFADRRRPLCRYSSRAD